MAGCGSGSVAAPPRTRPARPARPASARPHGPTLHVVRARSLPAPVQLPALAPAGGAVLAIGGLDARDVSVPDVVRVSPGVPRRVGALPQAVHDAGATGLGGRAYAFGGGSATGPTAAISAVSRGGRVNAADACRPRSPMRRRSRFRVAPT